MQACIDENVAAIREKVGKNRVICGLSFFFQAEDGIRDRDVTGVQTCALPISLRQAVTPDPLLGRVTATMICLTVATAPFGGLAGGWIAEHAGLRATLLLAGLGAIALVPLVAWASPLLRLRTLAEAREPRQTESLADELAGYRAAAALLPALRAGHPAFAIGSAL